MLFDYAALTRIRGISVENEYVSAGLGSLLEGCRKFDREAVEAIAAKMSVLAERSSLGYTKTLRFGNYVRNLSVDCLKMAFAYAFTGDRAMLASVRDILALVCSVQPWLFQGLSDGWKADLWTADIGMNLSLCYDTLKSELTESEKEMLEKSIIDKSILPIYGEWISPFTRVHALDSMGHNWWSVIVAGAGIGLVCLGKETLQKQGITDYDNMLEEVISGLLEWYRYPGNILQNKKGNFGKDGDYIEYVGYMLYAFSNLCVFDELLQKRNGDSRLFPTDILEKLPQYLLAFAYEADGRTGFADFGDTPFSTKTGHPLYYFASKLNHGELIRLIHKLYPVMQNPLDFYFYPQTERLCTNNLQNVLVYNHAGYAVVRSGYEPDETVFAMKAGDSWNHNHLDVGTFELIDKQHRFVADSGSCSYSNELYRSYYIKPKAHNIITCEGNGQVEESIYTGTKFPGSFPVLLNSTEYKYLLADCTGPYQNIYQRFYRHCLFIDGVIVMVDDIQSLTDCVLTAQIHTTGDIALLEDGFTLTCGQDVMRVYQFALNGIQASLEDGYVHAIAETEQTEEEAIPSKYVAARFGTVDLRQKCITCFMLPSAKRQFQDVTSTCGEAVQHITITYADGVKDHIFVNLRADGRVMHRNGIMELEGLCTDAFLTYIREKDGKLIRYAIHNGSFLKIAGKTRISSLIKQDVLVDEPLQSVSAAATAETGLFVETEKHTCRLKIKKGENAFCL